MPDSYWTADGIPKRLGATRCVLGTLRSSPDVVEATETITNHDDVTGCSARNPEHGVKYTDDEFGNKTYTAMTPYSTYPSKLPVSTNDTNTHLVIKARGELERDEDGTWLFPKIKLTLRPLFTRLDYKWIGDALAQSNLDAVTEFGGGYEEDVYGESVWMDFDFMYAYQADTLDDTAEDFDERYEQEREKMEHSYVERGTPLYLEGDFYWKSEDKPDNLGQEYAPPLQPWEIDLTLYPRADGEEAYEFKKNESWDLRYRYPLWYPNYGGSPYFTTTQQYPFGAWIYTPNPTLPPSENPFAKKDSSPSSPYANGIPNTLVPVEKYIRIQEGSPPFFPLLTPYTSPPVAAVRELYYLHQPKHIQAVTKVRKRYPFSFNAEVNAGNSQTFKVYDANPANRFFFEPDPENEPNIFQVYTIEGVSPFRGTDPLYYPDALNGVEKFNCQSWWRMEIETDRCEWNFDEVLDKGWTIKGKIKFAKKLLATLSTPNGAVKGQAPFQYFSGTVVSPTNGVYQNSCFGFFRPEDAEPDGEAGETDFTIQITRNNAVGSPVKILDFPIGGQTFIPNEAGDGYVPVQWGDSPERSINFITDFYITEIIPPSAE